MYRSWYRGCKETDILLGHFALEYLNKFSLNELIEYEKIINLDDYELYHHLLYKANLSTNIDSRIINLIIYFIESNLYTYIQRYYLPNS
ncbi:MAG: succinate dehydrogenase assembly factor 2 [Wolbachia pipientis]|nr:succinate dehydrogenase assembly factor 2 [Wolbachia pipientis]